MLLYERAKADPELAVLSAMAHGRDADPQKSLEIAVAAMTSSLSLDADRSALYADLVVAALSDAAKRSLQAMAPAKYEDQSEFARRYFSQGVASGRAALLLKLLQLKFGPLAPEAAQRVQSAAARSMGIARAERDVARRRVGVSV